MLRQRTVAGQDTGFERYRVECARGYMMLDCLVVVGIPERRHVSGSTVRVRRMDEVETVEKTKGAPERGDGKCGDAIECATFAYINLRVFTVKVGYHSRCECIYALG